MTPIWPFFFSIGFEDFEWKQEEIHGRRNSQSYGCWRATFQDSAHLCQFNVGSASRTWHCPILVIEYFRWFPFYLYDVLMWNLLNWEVWYACSSNLNTSNVYHFASRDIPPANPNYLVKRNFINLKIQMRDFVPEQRYVIQELAHIECALKGERSLIFYVFMILHLTH